MESVWDRVGMGWSQYGMESGWDGVRMGCECVESVVTGSQVLITIAIMNNSWDNALQEAMFCVSCKVHF